MKAQIIEKDGRPEFAVIPYADYERFLELIEDEADARAVAEFHAQIETGKRQGTVETLKAIALALDVPPDVLIG